MEIKYTKSVETLIRKSIDLAIHHKHEFITTEHVLTILLRNTEYITALEDVSANVEALRNELARYMSSLPVINNASNDIPELSAQFQEMMAKSAVLVSKYNGAPISIPVMTDAILSLKDSWSQTLLFEAIEGKVKEFLAALLLRFGTNEEVVGNKGGLMIRVVTDSVNEPDKIESKNSDKSRSAARINFTTNISEQSSAYNKLIGRKEEMARVLETMCRCDNNGVLLIGEPGVGKTAMIYGLAQRIESGDVPKRLKECKVYEIDVAGLSAGVQFKGELEARVRTVIDSVKAACKSAILYFDNINLLMSFGQNGDGNIDIMNIFRPYMETGKIFFIGTASHDDISKYMHKNKSFARKFQRVDLNEPSEAETIEILNCVKEKYERYHKVTYTDDALKSAVEMSARYIRGRFLPEKAIDILDQAGAYSEAGKRRKKQIGKDEIADTLKVKYNIKAVGEKDETQQLMTLESRIKSKIYGQDAAVKSVVEAVQLWKAGLTDRSKPVANLLFVGPTGVGKTEIAKTLAEEMGVVLTRFDMSEYSEKHTVAKLIGSPAGYVGYDDGGLLTEAILKNPNCVLLLDEIEKAHESIFNILLQVMDYGSLTDNRGKKADFQNVVLIMTSNAGAQYAHTASLGFASKTTKGGYMSSEVKKMFKPEFINRLSATVIFNDMDENMANLILTRKVKLFAEKLSDRGVEIKLDKKAHKWLLEKGITKEYGAREIERVLDRELKPLFVKEILFGKLKKGGNVVVTIVDDQLSLEMEQKSADNTVVEISVNQSQRQGRKTPSGKSSAKKASETKGE